MKLRHLALALILVLACSPAFAALREHVPSVESYSGRPFQPGELLVKFRPEVPSEVRREAHDLTGARLLRRIPALSVERIALPPGTDVLAAAEEYRRMDGVVYAHPNYLLQLLWQPRDWFYYRGHLWNLEIIGMEQAWDLDTTAPLHGGDPAVIVAVIDTGIAYCEHTDDYTESYPVHYAPCPDLNAANFWVNTIEAGGTPGVDDDGNGFIDDLNGWDWAGEDAFPLDDMQHGSHVAGTIAQATDNDPNYQSAQAGDYAGSGIAFNSTLMPLKVLGRESGGALVSDVAEAIVYATDKGAKVINLSLGADGVGTANYPDYEGDVEGEATYYAWENGVTVVAATGNEASDMGWSCEHVGISYPAGFPWTIGVGASENCLPSQPGVETRSSYSNYGYALDLVAPAGDWDEPTDRDGSGRDDFTWQQVARMNDYEDGHVDTFKFAGFTGTSMASPHVAGVAALIQADALARLGHFLTPDEVRARIDYAAHDIHDTGYDVQSGFGRLDAYAALTVEPKPSLFFKEWQVTELDGNGNYRPEGGERVAVVGRWNLMFAGTAGVQVALTTADPYVTIEDGSASLPAGEFKDYLRNDAQPFVFALSASAPEFHEAVIEASYTIDGASAVQHDTLAFRVNPPRILFVDDDRHQGKGSLGFEYEEYFTEALDAGGHHYDVYEIQRSNICAGPAAELPWEANPSRQILPTYEDVRAYDIVIWNMGCRGQTKRQLLDEMEPLWKQYLDNGGKFLLSSHEYLYKHYGMFDDPEYPDHGNDFGSTAAGDFARDYLKIDTLEHDEYYYDIYGLAGGMMAGLASHLRDLYSYKPNATEAGAYDFWPDNFTLLPEAEPLFVSGPHDLPEGHDPELDDMTDDRICRGPCALRYPSNGSGPYKVVFLGFPFESIEELGTRTEILNRILAWFEDDTPSPLGVRLEHPAQAHPGGQFFVTGRLDNPGVPLADVPVFFILEVYGEFWFWPGWKHYAPPEANEIDFMQMTVPTGSTPVVVLPTFDWPDTGAGTVPGLRFYGAMLNDTMDDIRGGFAMTEWGYGP